MILVSLRQGSLLVSKLYIIFIVYAVRRHEPLTLVHTTSCFELETGLGFHMEAKNDQSAKLLDLLRGRT